MEFSWKLRTRKYGVCASPEKEEPGSDVYENFEKAETKKHPRKKEELSRINEFIDKALSSDSLIKKTLGVEKYTLNDVENFSPKSFKLIDALIFQRDFKERGLSVSKLQDYKKGALIQ